MRELKFRAWHERYGMSKPFSVGGCPIFDFVSRLIDWESEVVVEQFTGLHDKNGWTEIYEGDIIDINGVVYANIHEREERRAADLVVEGMGTSKWRHTESEAIRRGCKYAE